MCRNTKIHRWGNKTYKNLTPRPKDTEGLSFNLNGIERKHLETFVESVNLTGLLVAKIDNKENGHVSVYPVDIETIYEWIASREESETSPHEYTILLHNIVKAAKI